jgi:hypothetical protein
MFKKLLAVAFLAMSSYAQAQLMPCSTDENYRLLLRKYPELKDYEEQLNEQVRNIVGARTTAEDTTIYEVPIVIHVVHDYGIENITDNVIYEAVDYWNTVYLKQNPDTITVIDPFKPYVGNSRIRFHLATKDPSGNPTKGIVRHNSYLTFAGGDQAKFENWPNNKYINIWSVNVFNADHSGAAAYAYTPMSASSIPYYDGIISLASYVNSTKTIPHELGHVLNLRHPWGNTNNPGVACGDDNVHDTPPTKGHSPSGCTAAALYDTVCAKGYKRTYTAVIGGADSIVDYPDTVNSQNIMDYTYCDRMFTKGQGARMRSALTSTTAGRNNLHTAANLAATGALAPFPDLPPVADFIINKANPGAFTDMRTYFLTYTHPASFMFRNASWNDTISGLTWTFSNGATTPTATSTIVSTRFTQPGWVTATLIATSNGGSDTLVDAHAVYAADTTPAGGQGYTQEFSNPADISNWPMFNFYKNPFQWQYNTTVGFGATGCIRYHSFDTTCITINSSTRRTGIAIGDHDDIYTPAFNLNGTAPTLYLDFFTCGAYTTRGVDTWDDQVYDSLEIDVSVTGGAQWKRLVTYKGTDLANNGNQSTDFVPTSSSVWKPRSLVIPDAYKTGNTFFRLRYWPGNLGNNTYIDRLSVSAWPAEVREALNSPKQFDVFPNPSSDGCTLTFKTGMEGSVNYCITDITGKVLLQATKQYDPNSVQQEYISRQVTPAAGMYFVIMNVDGARMTQKFVIY